MFVEDVDRTVAFYRDVLGFEVVRSENGGRMGRWGLVRRGEVELLFQARAGLEEVMPFLPASARPGRLTISVPLDDAAALYRRLPAEAVAVPLHETRDGARAFAVHDCNGVTLRFVETTGKARRAA